MSVNPFASFNVELPRKYSEDIKKYCKTGGGGVSLEYAPFSRQVDFWYFAFLHAVQERLTPVIEKDTVNITPASILSTDPYRISHIQLAYFAIAENIDALANHRKVFDFSLQMANAGIPFVLQILSCDDDKPLWNLIEQIEAVIAAQED